MTYRAAFRAAAVTSAAAVMFAALVGCDDDARRVPLPTFSDVPPSTSFGMPAEQPLRTSTAPVDSDVPIEVSRPDRPPLVSIPKIPPRDPDPEPEPEPEPEPQPPPPPPPAGPTVAVGSTLLFEGFDDLDLGEFSNMQAEGVNGDPSGECGRVCAVNAGPGHESAGRFEVRPGDEAAGGERAELRVGDAGDTSPGDERWYEFDLQFEDFPPPGDTNSGGHLIVMQWHTGSGSPLLTLNVDGEGNFTVGERWDDPAVIGPIDEGVWHSYVVHVEFSTGDDGLVEVWRDGVKVATRNQATHKDDSNYLKLGVYQGESEVRSVLYDDLRITGP